MSIPFEIILLHLSASLFAFICLISLYPAAQLVIKCIIKTACFKLFVAGCCVDDWWLIGLL